MNESERVERVLSTLLRSGVFISLGLIVLGTVLTFVRGVDHAAVPAKVSEIGRGLLELRGAAIVDLGLLCLIATPVMRVAVAIFIFAAEKDRRFMAITTVVLGLLLLSFALGRAGG